MDFKVEDLIRKLEGTCVRKAPVYVMVENTDPDVDVRERYIIHKCTHVISLANEVGIIVQKAEGKISLGIQEMCLDPRSDTAADLIREGVCSMKKGVEAFFDRVGSPKDSLDEKIAKVEKFLGDLRLVKETLQSDMFSNSYRLDIPDDVTVRDKDIGRDDTATKSDVTPNCLIGLSASEDFQPMSDIEVVSDVEKETKKRDRKRIGSGKISEFLL